MEEDCSWTLVTKRVLNQRLWRRHLFGLVLALPFSVCTCTLHTFGKVTSLQGGQPAGSRDCAVLQNIQTCLGFHPAFCSVVIGGCFPRNKAAGAWSWSLPLALMLKMSAGYLYSLICLSCMHKGDFILLYCTLLHFTLLCIPSHRLTSLNLTLRI